MPITKQQIVQQLITEANVPDKAIGSAFAPTNIALCKYWGKLDAELNLPITSSLSISLGNLGATTRVSLAESDIDQIVLNKDKVGENTVFYRRMVDFLDLFRPTKDTVFNVTTQTNIPVAAGLASSACGFAAITKALDDLFGWGLDVEQLSVLARFGSGSACRSLWDGFVLWNAGNAADGMDSHGVPIDANWPDLRIGIIMIDNRQKEVSSRVAMQSSVDTSPFYALWPQTVSTAIEQAEKSIANKDFWALGAIAESNALAMHAIMMSSIPPIIYSQPATLDYMQQVWRARAAGMALFFTQDAGPNLKLLFLAKDEARVRELFGKIAVVAPFALEHSVERIST